MKKPRTISVICFTLCFVLAAGATMLLLPGSEQGACSSAVGSSVETKAADGSSGQAPKPVIVIDAGHGGMDGGASAADGTQEKDISLEIAQRLAETASEYPVELVMTRSEDVGLYTDDGRSIREKKREDLNRRKELMEQEGVVLGISIHLNSFPQDEKVYGAQVFYPPQQPAETDVCERNEGQAYSSREFAEAVQGSLEISIDDGRRREAMCKKDILLFRNTSANMILVECGFLSNPSEAKRLKNAEYQRKLSEAIWKGINEILCIEKTEKVKIVESKNDSK